MAPDLTTQNRKTPRRRRSAFFALATLIWTFSSTAHAVSARPAATADPGPPRMLLSIVGDSTVAAYSRKSPIHGWGEFIQERMRARVRVSNTARAGASTASFITEGHWKDAIQEQPTVVLIQFGHNDSFQKLGLDQYRANLKSMIETARAAGAFPILVTPMQMRTFAKGKLVPNLQDYADAMQQVATETGTALVDLNDLSGQLYGKLGPARTQQLGAMGGDPTHFNAVGACAMAELVLDALTKLRTPLLREVLAPTTANAAPHRGP